MKGLRELGQVLGELQKDIQTKVARAAVNAGAQVIKKRAQQKVPISDPMDTPEVPPGYLRDSIIVRRQRRTRKTAEYAVTVRSRGKKVKLRKDGLSPYQLGVLNEFGTVKQGPKPWMRPAFEESKSAALEAMRKRLLARIAKANRKVR